ncbi:Os08g0493000 [Oryza sativa Japonica Group]|jgi:hypothetical protein|uniref:Os08g0493000 protein n=2 Tax=Oryza TaxID=4527 RepID=A0A0N7KQ25_ORYSJ|nr:Os08g0493000 [Oryza sativa Japonica Group]
MVGTLNGLLCLYEELAGDIVVLNPVTGETPLHIRGPAGNRLDPAALSFVYQEKTGQYKIVHLRRLPISLAARAGAHHRGGRRFMAERAGPRRNEL